MRFTLALLFSIIICAVAAPDAGAETITVARYDRPVDRYGHFAPGRPHEYAVLTAHTDTGRELSLALPDDEVFEDTTPRLVMINPKGAPELLTIVSSRQGGSRLVLIGLQGGGIRIVAQSAPIGTPRRWLNPVGVADLDDDGRAEIAAVITPHIGGTLKIYRRQGRDLIETAALDGFSNHVLGSSEQRLSLAVKLAGSMQLVVPDAARRHLRLIRLDGGRLVETGRCALRAPVVGPLTLISATEVSVGVEGGQQMVTLSRCLSSSAGGM